MKKINKKIYVKFVNNKISIFTQENKNFVQEFKVFQKGSVVTNKKEVVKLEISLHILSTSPWSSIHKFKNVSVQSKMQQLK